MTAQAIILGAIDDRFEGGYTELAKLAQCSRRQAIRVIKRLIEAGEVVITVPGDASTKRHNRYESREMAITLTVDALICEIETCQGVWVGFVASDASNSQGGEAYTRGSDYPEWYRGLCASLSTSKAKVIRAMESNRDNLVKSHMRLLAIEFLQGNGDRSSRVYSPDPHPLFADDTEVYDECPF